MVQVVCFCAAGFSTGMLVNNMKIAAAEKGLEAEIRNLLSRLSWLIVQRTWMSFVGLGSLYSEQIYYLRQFRSSAVIPIVITVDGKSAKHLFEFVG